MDRTVLLHAPRRFKRQTWVLIGFLVVAAFFLWSEHRAHLFGVLPYLLVLACPLMHLFHHGHGHKHHQHDTASDAGQPENANEPAGGKS